MASVPNAVNTMRSCDAEPILSASATLPDAIATSTPGAPPAASLPGRTARARAARAAR